MGLDVYSMAMTRQAELERALRRQERLRQAGVRSGPSPLARLSGLATRFARRERIARPAAVPSAQIYCLTTRAHEPV